MALNPVNQEIEIGLTQDDKQQQQQSSLSLAETKGLLGLWFFGYVVWKSSVERSWMTLKLTNGLKYWLRYGLLKIEDHRGATIFGWS